MATILELRELTMELTKRPELTALTDSSIRTATLRAHHTDFFRRDLVVSNFTYALQDCCCHYDFANISTVLTRLRTLKNVYSITPTGHQTEILDYRESDDLYDADGMLRPYIYTLIGDTLRVFPVNPTGAISVYFFRNPEVSGTNYSSWIADTYPDDLAGWAAAIVMARTGFLELANLYQEQYVKPLKQQLIASHLLGVVS